MSEFLAAILYIAGMRGAYLEFETYRKRHPWGRAHPIPARIGAGILALFWPFLLVNRLVGLGLAVRVD